MDLQEKMKQEALSRMTSLELYAGAISLFKNSGVVTVSYQGSLTELSEAQAKKVCEFEKETGFLVYHAIRTDTGIGILLTLGKRSVKAWMKGTPIAMLSIWMTTLSGNAQDTLSEPSDI